MSEDNNLIVPDAISIEDCKPINGGDSGDIVPNTEDDKGNILAATDKVGSTLLGSNELNNRNLGGLLIADEIDINLPDEIDINSPIVTEPDDIKSADATLSSNIINGAEVDTTKIAATVNVGMCLRFIQASLLFRSIPACILPRKGQLYERRCIPSTR